MHLSTLIKDWLLSFDIPENWAIFIKTIILTLSVALLCLIINFITKKIIIRIVAHFVRKSKTKWDDIYFEKGVFNKLSHYIPAFIIYYSARHVLADYSFIIRPVIAATYLYMVFVTLTVANSFINATHEIYLLLPLAKSRPIKGYIQVIKISIFFIGGILILAILLGESPYALLAGLGALAAVLLLVFKDTLLGLTASVQLSENKMLKPGDYIILAKDNIEGTVQEISLSSVKIKNPDNSINYVPTYSLISQPFSNWIGVEEAKARRIKRSINIEIRNIKFCSDNLLKKLNELTLLKDYLKTINEQQSSNYELRTTNLGLYRKYIELYLKMHPKLNTKYPFLIHQLQPVNSGLPLEIYAFVNEMDWIIFEEIQSELLEHLIAIMREFELSPFQSLQ